MRLFIMFIWFFLTNCSTSVDTSQNFIVQMFGTSQTPDGAAGDKSPISQNYTLTGINLTGEDGSSVTTLFSGETTTERKIVNRPQIIFSKDIETLKNTTFSSLTLSFSPTITGTSANSQDHTFTMQSPDVTLTQALTVEEGEDVLVYLKVQWKNTVLDTAMSEPGYNLSLAE